MKIVDHILQKFSNVGKLNIEYVKSPPYPNIALDDFLPADVVKNMKHECDTIEWTREFTRNKSKMLERQNISECPVALSVQQALSSTKFLDWLGKLTGHDDLIPDPHMIGAGYMRCQQGDSLKLHSDFNFNNTLGLYRLISINIYLNPNWQNEWNGDFQLWDFDRTRCVTRYYPEAGRAVIWRHHKFGFHGHPKPLECPIDVHRDGFRIFYYVSGSKYNRLDTQPHRSLYWYDNKTKQPYDVTDEE